MLVLLPINSNIRRCKIVFCAESLNFLFRCTPVFCIPFSAIEIILFFIIINRILRTMLSSVYFLRRNISIFNFYNFIRESFVKTEMFLDEENFQDDSRRKRF